MTTRYYAAGLGRFTTGDVLFGEVSDPMSLNRFAYALGSPVTFTDPSGLRSTSGTDERVFVAEFRNDYRSEDPEQYACVYEGACAVPLWERVVASVGLFGVWVVAAVAEGIVLGEVSAAVAVSWVAAGVRSTATKIASMAGSVVVAGRNAINRGAVWCESTPSCARAFNWARGISNTGTEDDASSAGSRIAANKTAGDAARDRVAAQYPGSQIEVYHPTDLGGRYTDVLTPGQVAIESKVGYTTLTTAVQQQIAKDALLRQSGVFRGNLWIFSPSPTTGLIGPSQPLQDALAKAGISWTLG